MQPAENIKGEELVSVSRDELEELQGKAATVPERERVLAGLMRHRVPAPRRPLQKVKRELTPEEKAALAARKKRRLAQRDARKRNRSKNWKKGRR